MTASQPRPSDQGVGQRQHWAMGLALEQAALALRTGDVPVGAVVLGPDGGLLGLGRNQREELQDPTAHAEVQAIRAAAIQLGQWRLVGCTLVVTLEPCAMCAGAIVLARIPQIVLGTWDAKAGATGSVWNLVRDRQSTHWVEVIAGIRTAECAQLLTDFFAERRMR